MVFATIFINIFIYFTSTFPLHTLYYISTNSPIAVFDTSLKNIKLIRVLLSRERDGTFELFRWHLPVVPTAPPSCSDGTLGGVPSMGTLCFSQGNTLFPAWERVETNMGTSRDKHGNGSRQAWELIEV